MRKIVILFLIVFTCVSCATTSKEISETGKKISDTFFLSSLFNPFAAVISLAGEVMYFSGEAAGYIANQHKTDNIEEKAEEKKDVDAVIIY